MANSSIKHIAPAPSILIILMGSLGDVARGLCLIDHIKRNLPQSRVTWLVESKWSELVRLNRQIDRVIILKRSCRLSAVWGLFEDLRRDHYDITLDLQRILKSGFISLLSGAKRRIGFHRRNAKEFNWIFNNDRAKRHPLRHRRINLQFRLARVRIDTLPFFPYIPRLKAG